MGWHIGNENERSGEGDRERKEGREIYECAAGKGVDEGTGESSLRKKKRRQ